MEKRRPRMCSSNVGGASVLVGCGNQYQQVLCASLSWASAMHEARKSLKFMTSDTRHTRSGSSLSIASVSDLNRATAVIMSAIPVMSDNTVSAAENVHLPCLWTMYVVRVPLFDKSFLCSAVALQTSQTLAQIQKEIIPRIWASWSVITKKAVSTFMWLCGG